VKLGLLMAAAMLSILTTTGSSQGAAKDEEVVMPEVTVSGQAVDRQHPQDNTYSERPLGCVEVVTPHGTGNELGGYFLARNAKEGIPVIPSLNDPSSASEYGRRREYQNPATPPGQEGKPGCNR
jgi:hypothetical protein